jgi:hypothetical protein
MLPPYHSFFTFIFSPLSFFVFFFFSLSFVATMLLQQGYHLFISPLSMKVHPLHLFMTLLFFQPPPNSFKFSKRKEKKKAPLLTNKSK